MNRDSFTPAAQKHLVEGTSDGRPYVAFVPPPLPPDFTLTKEMLRLGEDAALLLGRLGGAGSRMGNLALLINAFRRREAVLSSSIEGINTTVSALYAYEAGQLLLPGLEHGTDAESEAVLEVRNYVETLDFGLAVINERPINLPLLRELHFLLLKGARGGARRLGDFRDEQVHIGPSHSKVWNATYVPPPVLMRDCLEDFQTYLTSEDELSKLIRAGLIHYQFEAIHPFFDGNGRIGRLLISLLLAKWNVLPSPLLYLSGYLEANRPRYYHLLQSVSERGAWEEWLVFFLNGIIEQAQDTLWRIEQLEGLQQRMREQVEQLGTSRRLVQLVDLLFEQPVLNSGVIQKRLSIKNPTARDYLERFADAGLVRHEPRLTRSRLRWYVASDILAILDA
jgi:Fic family protein